MYAEIIRIRLLESKLLSPEFDFLEIDDKGLLKEPYPIPNSHSFTYDKVAAASYIKGYEYMKIFDNNGMIPYFVGRNEIYYRVLRNAPYDEDAFDREMKKMEEKEYGRKL